MHGCKFVDGRQRLGCNYSPKDRAMLKIRPNPGKCYAGALIKECIMTDDRLLNIETTVAYQDDLLNALNRTVADQAMRIDALEKQLNLAVEQLQQISELLLSMDIVDEKPPHY
jgi:SlyX protein